MLSLTGAVRMTWAAAGGHSHKVIELVATVLAGVFAFFGAFIEPVLALTGAVRMAWAGAGRKTADVIELMAAIDAIEIWHIALCFIVVSLQYKHRLRHPLVRDDGW